MNAFAGHEGIMYSNRACFKFFFCFVTVLALPVVVLAEPSQKIPAGAPTTPFVSFEYAVFYLPAPSKDPLAALGSTLRAKTGYPKLVNAAPKKLTESVVMARLEKNVSGNYKAPDLQFLRYFGHGLSREQALALQNSQQALVLNFGHARAHVWTGLHAATEIVEKLARETNGLIWDEETREVFTPDAWHERRLAGWKSMIPNVTRHTTIHAYKDGEFVRAITLGMGKFGLPDVVAQDFSWSLNNNIGHLINALCQSLAEGGQLPRAGEYELDFRLIKDMDVRNSYLTSLKPNAKAVARLILTRGKAEKGDPSNELIEIGFGRYPGVDLHARQESMLTSLFGWEDSVKRIRHNEELKATSRQARSKLPALRKAFNTGLAPGEYIQVKAPFATPKGSNEWMWVEITEWKGDAIRGLLKNEPFDIPTLHGGQVVQVRESEVFDYIRRYPDGREEGNETGKIILKMQGETEKNK